MWWMQQCRCAKNNHQYTNDRKQWSWNDVKENDSKQQKIRSPCVCLYASMLDDGLCYVNTKRKLNSLPKLSVSNRIMDFVAFLFLLLLFFYACSCSLSLSILFSVHRCKCKRTRAYLKKMMIALMLAFWMFYFPTFDRRTSPQDACVYVRMLGSCIRKCVYVLKWAQV